MATKLNRKNLAGLNFDMEDVEVFEKFRSKGPKMERHIPDCKGKEARREKEERQYAAPAIEPVEEQYAIGPEEAEFYLREAAWVEAEAMLSMIKDDVPSDFYQRELAKLVEEILAR